MLDIPLTGFNRLLCCHSGGEMACERQILPARFLRNGEKRFAGRVIVHLNQVYTPALEELDRRPPVFRGFYA